MKTRDGMRIITVIGTLLFSIEAAGQIFTVDPGLFNQTLPDHLGLGYAVGTETHTIFKPSASTDNFSNGAVMTVFDGYLYCMWQSSAQIEDAADTWVAYSRSTDGINWTAPMVLAESITNGYCSSGGWWVSGDRLIAYINVWPSSVSPRGGYTHYKTSTDGLTWSAMAPVKMQDGSDMAGIFEQDPHALPDGRIINAVHFQPGLICSPVFTDDPGGTNGWVRAAFTNLSISGDVSREIEPSWFLKSDDTVVMTFRDQNSTYYKLASGSSDRGETWSLPELTNMRDSRSKQGNGNLAGGAAFMVNNPNNDKLRIPLAVTLSDDGSYFDRAYLLRAGGSDLQDVQFPGPGESTTKKRPGYHYPKAMVWNGYLYVSYTTNKEDVEYTRIPVSSLQLAPAAYPLPDPLTLNNGSTVTSASQWTGTRRTQILNLFKNHMHGTTLVGKRAAVIRFTVREEIPDALGGKATRLRIGILFEGTEEGRDMELLVYLPNDAIGPVPLFLGLNFDGNFSTTTEPDIPVTTDWVYGLFFSAPYHIATEAMRGHNADMWPYDMILDRGYGIATAHYTDIEPDMDNNWWHGPRVWPREPVQNTDWGAIGAWAWGLSRALDWIETDPRIDASKVAVLGFSRLGKTAMWAGAQDQRFAAVVSQCSGKGGVSLSKRLTGEPISNLVTKFPHWYSRKYQDYSDNEGALPVDGHMLASLIAPRGLLILSGAADSWSDPEGEFLSGVAATPVYELLGSEGLAATNWPAAGTLINSPIGYYMHSTGHDVTTDDWEATLDWADTHLNPPDGYYYLQVLSDYGSPEPDIGLNPLLAGTVVTCSVPSTAAAGTTNYACAGWSGTGDVPASGSATSTGPITLTQDSSITWDWVPAGYYLDIWVEGNGSCSEVSGFQPIGSNVNLTATPAPGWLFVEWTGDLTGSYHTASTNLVMDAPRSITAVFSDDADGDGILNDDEAAYGTSARNADTDGDMLSDYDEINIHGTSPVIGDVDYDGLSDGEEFLIYHTDFNVADTDMDGFDDGFEVSTGFDPADDAVRPDLYSVIQPAIEYRFYASTSFTYRIEATDALSNSWSTIESGITDEAPVVRRLYSVEGQSNRYFRARFD